MKKILTIALALVFALSLTVGASAAYGIDVDTEDGIVAALADIAGDTSDTFNALWNDLRDLVPEADLIEILQGLLVDIDLDNDLSDADRDYIVSAFLSELPIDAEGGLADRISNMMSNDFLSFLAGLYVPSIGEPATTAPPTTTTVMVETGDSSVIAIAAFATISVAAAAAFVLLKKKEK